MSEAAGRPMLMASTSVADVIATMGPAAPGSPACSSRCYCTPGRPCPQALRSGAAAARPRRSARSGWWPGSRFERPPYPFGGGVLFAPRSP